MATCFLDTCALVPRYVKGKFTYRVNQLFASKRDIFIAEISMIEIVSAFGSLCRDRHLPDADFEQFNSAFLDDIESERIQIRPLSRVDMLKARHLLSLGGIVNRRSLKSSDALVAVSCRELALDMGERLIFYTKDWRLYSTLHDINAYRSALKLRFLGTGRGNIPASTN
jgi:hypothetical protein